MNLVDDDLAFAAAPFVQFHDMESARRAHRLAHFAGLHLDDQVQDELGQLGAFAPAELAAVQRRLAVRIRNGELPEVFALGGARRELLRLVRDFIELLGRRGFGQRQKNVRDVEFVVGGLGLLARQELLEFVRADVDVRDHVALAQGGQGQLLAHGLAILLVVDALRRQRGRQLIEGDLIAAGDFLQGAVQLLVRHGQTDPLGVLRLNFLQYQPVEHLLLEHALRGQLHLLFLQPLGDRVHLRIEFAFQHQAVVHDGGDAVEHLAVHADVPGLRVGRRRQQHCRGPIEAIKGSFTHASRCPGLKGPSSGHWDRGSNTHESRVPRRYSLVFRPNLGL